MTPDIAYKIMGQNRLKFPQQKDQDDSKSHEITDRPENLSFSKYQDSNGQGSEFLNDPHLIVASPFNKSIVDSESSLPEKRPSKTTSPSNRYLTQAKSYL